MNKIKIILFSTIILLSCSKENLKFIDYEIEDSGNTPNESVKPNILLIIADDMGLDASPGYNIGSIKPHMPNIENLARTGITFNNVWSNPTCSPTRATILTGKYGFRTNVLQVDDELSTSEISIQKYLDNNLGNEYNHAVIGKWHLSKNINHPNNMGINHYTGSIGGGLQSYWNWGLTENGNSSNSTEYSTTKYTDLAIDWVQYQTQPWFLWLAYNAPHSPFHLPASNMHYQGDLPTDQATIDSNPTPYYMAMLEAMDSEIGRLLSSMTSEKKANTIIIFIGDNGTPNQVVQEYPSQRAKGSLYQGGINVPMIIAGKNVSRKNTTEDALINTTDLFSTIANIAGISVSNIHDSQNFKDLLSNTDAKKRTYTYAETELDVTIRNNTYKYILFNDGYEAFYALSNDPLETKNLLNKIRLPLSASNEIIYKELVKKLTEIRN